MHKTRLTLKKTTVYGPERYFSQVSGQKRARVACSKQRRAGSCPGPSRANPRAPRRCRFSLENEGDCRMGGGLGWGPQITRLPFPMQPSGLGRPGTETDPLVNYNVKHYIFMDEEVPGMGKYAQIIDSWTRFEMERDSKCSSLHIIEAPIFSSSSVLSGCQKERDWQDHEHPSLGVREVLGQSQRPRLSFL